MSEQTYGKHQSVLLKECLDAFKLTGDENNSLIYQEVNHTIFLITIIDNRSFHSY